MKYKYTITGKSKENGKYYVATSFCNGMSKDELEQFYRENNFQEDTIKIKKEKICKNVY